MSLTPKQERFCAVYLETGNATEAYRSAYDTSAMLKSTVWRKAKELIENGKITARLAELRAPVVEAAQITLAGHLQTLGELRDKAIAAGKYGPAIQAEIARGRASGLYVERTELSGPNGGPIHAVADVSDAVKRAVEEVHRSAADRGDAPPVPDGPVLPAEVRDEPA